MGTIVARSDPTQMGQPLRERADLAALVNEASPLDQLRVIYSQEGQSLEVRQPMRLGDEAFGSIRIGVSTLLMRQEVNASLQPALVTAAIALAVAVLVAALLAQLLLRPIHVIRSGLTRLGKGEFGVTLDLPPGDEFGELGTFFNTVSQQLSADRTLLAGQKANLQSAVENLEDAVALFNPSGELLFSNPAMQPTLPAHAIGRALHGLLAHRPSVPHDRRRDIGDPEVARAGARQERGARMPSGPESGADRAAPDDARHRRDRRRPGGRARGRAESRLPVEDAVDARLFAQARGARPADGRHRARGEEPAQRDDDPPGAAAHEDSERQVIAVAAAGGGRRPRASSEAPRAARRAGRALEHVEIIESEIRRLDEVVQGFLKFTRPEDLRLQPVQRARRCSTKSCR